MGMTAEDVLKKCREYFVILSDWYDSEAEIDGELVSAWDMLDLIDSVTKDAPAPEGDYIDIMEWNRIAK